MPKTNNYTGIKSENGTFSCHVNKDVNFMLDMYCKINQINKTAYVNELIYRDMQEKFNRLKEDKKNAETEGI